MYRHFAIVTIALTALLAVFAEGEKADASSLNVEERRPHDEVVTAGRETAEPAAQQPGGVWGSETQAVGGNSILSGATSRQVSGFGAGFLDGGYSPEYLARMTPQERADLELAVAENTGGSQAVSRSQAASLEAASRRRSGSAGRE
jgi:hypothetical protein